MNDNQRRKIRPSMGIAGVMGLMGFLGIGTGQPTFFAFFGFFGFFSWYWWGKLAQEPWDERLTENQLRATNFAMQFGFGFIFAAMIISGNLISSDNPTLAYSVLIAIVSLGFAAAMNLTAYLTYKYDREG